MLVLLSFYTSISTKHNASGKHEPAGETAAPYEYAEKENKPVGPQNKTKELRQSDAVLAIIKNQSKLKVTSPSLSTNFALKRLPFLDTKSVRSAVDPVASKRAASEMGISRRQMLTPILKLQPSE